MGRIKCGDGEDGEPVGAHRADPNGWQRAGIFFGASRIHWGGCEAEVVFHLSVASFEMRFTTWLVENCSLQSAQSLLTLRNPTLPANSDRVRPGRPSWR